MMKRYFITGTDTDCGKTYVTCQLLDQLNRQHKAQAIKPVASGCIYENGLLINNDVRRLQNHNNDPEQIIYGWQYLEPVSPHIAAKKNNEVISVSQIAHFCEAKQFQHVDYLLVEGAGGLLVPLNEQETWLDFLKLTRIPVILVVGMRLGCINHALLTDAVLKMNNISCVGWIANCLDQSMLVIDENIATLSARMHMPLIATLGYCDNILHGIEEAGF